MADPLEGLRKARTIEPAPPAGGEGFRTALNSGIEALTGLVGFGPDTQSNRFGQMLGAAIPLVGAEGRLPKILEDIFTSNPGARRVYEDAMESQMFQHRGEQAALRDAQIRQGEATRSALMDLDEGYPRPITTETGLTYAVPLEGLKQPGTTAIGGAPLRKFTSGKGGQTPINIPASGFESKYLGAGAKAEKGR